MVMFIVCLYLAIMSICCSLLLYKLFTHNILSKKFLLLIIGSITMCVCTFVHTIVYNRKALIYYANKLPQYFNVWGGWNRYNAARRRFFDFQYDLSIRYMIIFSILSIILVFLLFCIIFLLKKDIIKKYKRKTLIRCCAIIYFIISLGLVLLGQTKVEQPWPYKPDVEYNGN